MPSGPKDILAYILQMETLCQRLHRHDLAGEYREAWEAAALAIYGPLPARAQAKQLPQPTAESATEKPIPRWRQEKYARPLRRVIAVCGDFEILECGHKVWRPIVVDGEIQAKHRRCRDCRELQKQEANKKAPQRETPPQEEKQA